MEHLTEQQKEVWRKEEDYWACWKTGDVEKLMALFHPNMVAWPRECAGPVTKDSLRAVMAAIFKNINTAAISTELRPHSILFHAETAFVYYSGDMFWKNPSDDSDQHADGRILHIWAKHEGEWKIIGGMTAELNRDA